MATGILVADALDRASPQTMAAIRALMAAHPDKARFAAVLAAPPGRDADRELLARMARWPDDLRHTSGDRPKWHYQLAVVSGWTMMPLRFGEAKAAYEASVATLRDLRRPAADRAIALCWLLHIVGDIHQPLHAGQRLDERFPTSDRAGSTGFVRLSAQGQPLTLHQFWDRTADTAGPEYAGALTTAQDAAASGATLPENSIGDLDRWTQESRTIAHDIAYRGAALNEAGDPKEAPILSPGYIAQARIVADHRIAQAGARAARLIASLLE